MAENFNKLRNSVDTLMKDKQALMSANRYNKLWRDIAESWYDRGKLSEIKTKLNKIKPSNIVKIRSELKELQNAGEISKAIKLNQSEAKLKEVLNNYKNPLKFDNDDQEGLFQVNQKKKFVKPTKTSVKKYRTTLTETRFDNNDDVDWGYSSFNIIYHSISTLYEELARHHNLKVSFHFNLALELKDTGEITDFMSSPPQTTMLNKSDVKEGIADTLTYMRNFIPELEAKNTGLIFRYVKNMYVNISKYAPLKGGSYIKLDKYLTNKKCCINIQNEDNKCLMYCVLYHINKDKITTNPQRVSKYNQYLEQFDFSTIKFPASLRDVKKMEDIIDHGINVFYYDEKKVYPVLNTTRRDDKIINLLLLKDENTEHYVYISKLDILVSANKYDENNIHVSAPSYTCPNCLHCFSSKERLDKHRKNGCDLFKPVATKMPQLIDGKTPVIKFKNHKRKFKSPVVIYADFETLCSKIEHQHDTTKSSTTKFIEQKPCGACFNVVSDYPEMNLGLHYFRGENSITEFLDKLIECGDKINKSLQVVKPMIITPEQEREFKTCKNCHICGHRINDEEKNFRRVRDHDHYSGLYRGCAHSICNLNLNYTSKSIQDNETNDNKELVKHKYDIPVYFHNLKGFDGHLIIKELSKKNLSNIKIIAQNFEKYVTFNVLNLQFMDSFAFLSSSLDTLATNLLKNGMDNFKHTLQGNLTDKQKDLILKKGVYPYEYMDCVDKFNETALPTIDKFYSTLNEDTITNKDYEHALAVWQEFNIHNLGEYHDLYLKTDVLLLTDIFENFRKTAMKFYELDPANSKYFTLPSFAWDAMLKKTKVKLDQMTDVDMYNFCDKGLRGGTSMISHRYAKANNKYMKNYDVNDISSYIIYLDANNLYGHAMIQKLPTGDLKWIEPTADVGNLHDYINSLECDDDVGYFVECDLHYPKELHDLHNSYPLAVEKKTINENELSPYQLNQLKTHDEKHSEKIEKLIPNFYDKKDYVCHIKNLKYYIEKGLIVTKINRIVQFKQSDWLKSYIDFNTEQRTKSKNDFEKDFFKLMNNAVFGKTMENMRNRVDIKLYSHDDEKLVLKQVAKPQYVNHKIYSESLVAIQQLKKTVELNKPIYVGLSVLDLSKLHMYKFHYDYISPKYGNNQQLLFTDTDSLCYHIKTDDLYKDMSDDKQYFDMSGYNMDGYRACDNTNKKVIGKFKDETDGVPIVEFCGLRSKMYSIKLDDDKEKKTGKGIKKSALKKKVTHENYYKCLFGEQSEQRQLVSFNNMRSINHTIYGMKFTKVGLSCSNDKQYLLDDGISNLSYGHYKISPNSE